MSDTLYKVLNVDGTAFHGGNGKWPLPTKTGKPGRWLKVEGKIVPTKRLLRYLNEPAA